MGNKRTGTYKKPSYKRKIQNLRGCNAVCCVEAAPTEMEAAHTEIEATPEIEIEAAPEIEIETAPVVSTWVEAVGEKEVNDEKEKGVEGKFPILCLECSVQMPSSPPTEDDWYQVEMPLSNVVRELDEAGLDKFMDMRFKFTKTKRGSNFNIGHGQGTSRRTHQRREKSSMDLGEHAKNTKKMIYYFHSIEKEEVLQEEEEEEEEEEEVLQEEEEEEVLQEEEEEDEIGQMLREAEAESERQAEAHVKIKNLYSDESLEHAMKELRDGLATNKKNVMTERDSSFMRVLAKALLAYYSSICYEGKSRMEESQNVAFYFYQKDEHVNTYRSRMIRAWGDEYLKSKSLPVFMQGVHSKVRSVITDEDVQHKF